MATIGIKTMMGALLAGSLAIGAGDIAFARGSGAGHDPAHFQQRIEKRVDKALSGTDATAEQKAKVREIVQAAFTDMKAFRDQRVDNRKAMEAAMQAPTIDPAKIEQIRVAQMKIADDTSKRFTKAMIDAGNVLSASQRQAFFKSWGEHFGKRG